MRELKEIVKDIRDTEKTASIKEADIPYKSRPGMGMAIRAAQDKLPGLTEELKKTVIPLKLIAVHATGDEVVVTKVAEFLEKNGGLVLNASGVYFDICKEIEPTYDRSRNFSTTQHNVMLRKIREIAQDLDYGKDLPAPAYKETLCRNVTETMVHVRKAIRDSLGDDFNKKYLAKKLIDSLLKNPIEANRIPILVIEELSLEEKANLSTLFITNIDYKFTPDFTITSKNLSKIYKNSQNGNNATNGDENKEGE